MTRFCPNHTITRGEMAAFLARALNLKASNKVDFVDDNGHLFERPIQAIAAAGITRGCNPPANNRFCPNHTITRGEMAAFLARALNLKASNKVNFGDDNGHLFEGAIQSIAAAGITKGCNPPNNDRFCPRHKVTRGQMAAFLTRALKLPVPNLSRSTLKKSGPVVINDKRGVVIQGLNISNPDGPCIEIRGSADVVVRDSAIGPCGERAIEVGNSSKVTLQRLEIHDSKSGIYAVNSQGLAVVGSSFQNAGRNFVQFDKVTGAGNRISNNRGANALGKSNAEDFVSVYKSSGTSSSPILVNGNDFRNGGPSNSGSGIMVGDLGGSHIVVRGNTLRDTGQVGIGVAGGTNIKVLDNVVTSKSHPWSNVGIYVWNQSDGSCSGIEVRGNSVNWSDSGGNKNPAWNSGSCGSVSGWSQNSFSK